MKRRTLILVHVTFWLYTFFFMEIALQVSYGRSWDVVFKIFNPLGLSNYLILLIVFYLNYLLVLPRLMNRSRYFQLSLAWLILVSGFVMLRYFIQEVFLLRYFNTCNYCEFELHRYIISNFFQAISWILLPGTVIWLLDSKLKEERKNIALQEEKLKSERAYLQAQLNPHFVFNSLHTIYSMVFHKAEESLDAIKTFSDILRHALNPTKSELVSLETELTHLRKYIALQEYRNRNPTVSFIIEGSVENFKIPPLLLITFVENAFKHGVYTDPLYPILIQMKVDESTMYFSVKNKINMNRPQNSTSIGLSSMRRILEITYGDKHNLVIKEENGFYDVFLIIKQA